MEGLMAILNETRVLAPSAIHCVCFREKGNAIAVLRA
jgi:hypothetical protein